MHRLPKISLLLLTATLLGNESARAQMIKTTAKTNTYNQLVYSPKEQDNNVCYNPNVLSKPVIDTTLLQNIVPINTQTNNLLKQTIDKSSLYNHISKFSPKISTQVSNYYRNNQITTGQYDAKRNSFSTSDKKPMLPGYQLKPYTSNKRYPIATNLTSTKYIVVLYTKEITFKINTSIELTQSFHFTPDSNKTIGLDIGIKLHFNQH